MRYIQVVGSEPTQEASRKGNEVTAATATRLDYTVTAIVGGEIQEVAMRDRHEAIDACRKLRATDPAAEGEVADAYDGKVIFTLTPATVGMLATMCHVNDRYAGKVVSVKRNGREVEFAHEGNESGEAFTLRKDGRYVAKGSESYPYLSLGDAQSYRAPEI